MDALPRFTRSSKPATTATAPSAIRQRIRVPRPLARVTPTLFFRMGATITTRVAEGNPFSLDDDQDPLGRGVVPDPKTVDGKKSRRRDEFTCGACVGESNRRPVGTCWEAAVLPLNYTRSRRGFYRQCGCPAAAENYLRKTEGSFCPFAAARHLLAASAASCISCWSSASGAGPRSRK
jgi:hypothetical protein